MLVVPLKYSSSLEVRPPLGYRKYLTRIRNLSDFSDFICLEVFRLARSKYRTFGSEMLQYEADVKTRMYVGVDVPETPVGVFIFDQNGQC